MGKLPRRGLLGNSVADSSPGEPATYNLLMPVEDSNKLSKHGLRTPSNPHIKIWRYMDFAKYMSLLDTGALFFPRSDTLEDPHEGTVTVPNAAELKTPNFFNFKTEGVVSR